MSDKQKQTNVYRSIEELNPIGLNLLDDTSLKLDTC